MHKSMVSAHVPDHSMQVNLNEEIHVSKDVDRAINGSCNACTPFTQAMEYQVVTKVELRGLTFRLCPACKAKLKLAL